MGMTSVLIISNDHLSWIANDDSFGYRVDSDVRTFPFSRSGDGALGCRGAVVSIDDESGEQLVSVQHGHGAPLPIDEVLALEKYRRSRDRKAKRDASKGLE